MGVSHGGGPSASQHVLAAFFAEQQRARLPLDLEDPHFLTHQVWMPTSASMMCFSMMCLLPLRHLFTKAVATYQAYDGSLDYLLHICVRQLPILSSFGGMVACSALRPVESNKICVCIASCLDRHPHQISAQPTIHACFFLSLCRGRFRSGARPCIARRWSRSRRRQTPARTSPRCCSPSGWTPASPPRPSRACATCLRCASAEASAAVVTPIAGIRVARHDEVSIRQIAASAECHDHNMEPVAHEPCIMQAGLAGSLIAVDAVPSILCCPHPDTRQHRNSSQLHICLRWLRKRPNANVLPCCPQVQKFSALLHSAGAAAPDATSAPYGSSRQLQQPQRAGFEQGAYSAASVTRRLRAPSDGALHQSGHQYNRS